MSSKKMKSKSKRYNEGDSSAGPRDGSTDSVNLQTSLNNNSFVIIDFIEKGKFILDLFGTWS